jgi:hypothetical protein
VKVVCCVSCMFLYFHDFDHLQSLDFKSVWPVTTISDYSTSTVGTLIVSTWNRETEVLTSMRTTPTSPPSDVVKRLIKTPQTSIFIESGNISDLNLFSRFVSICKHEGRLENSCLFMIEWSRHKLFDGLVSSFLYSRKRIYENLFSVLVSSIERPGPLDLYFDGYDITELHINHLDMSFTGIQEEVMSEILWDWCIQVCVEMCIRTHRQMTG